MVLCWLAKISARLRHAANFADTRQGGTLPRYEHAPTAGGNAGQPKISARPVRLQYHQPAPKPTHFFPSCSTPACLSNVRFHRFSSDSAGAVSDAMRAATPVLSGGADDEDAAADIFGDSCVFDGYLTRNLKTSRGKSIRSIDECVSEAGAGSGRMGRGCASFS